jgi:hypothetical protein
MTLTSAGSLGIGTHTPSAKLEIQNSPANDWGISVWGNTTTGQSYGGIIRGGTNSSDVAFRVNNAANSLTYFTVQGNGNVGIGTGSPSTKLHVTNTSAGESRVALFLHNNSTTLNTETRLAFAANTNDDVSSNRYSYISALNTSSSNGQALLFATNETGASAVERMRIGSNGFINLGTFTYNNTTTNLPNLFIDTTGGIYRSTTSSERNKDNISDWKGSGLDVILALKPRTFNYKPEYYKYPEEEILGLIAEEVAEVSHYLAEFENQDKTGQVENVKYATIVVPLIKAIQELKTEIDSLKNQIK